MGMSRRVVSLTVRMSNLKDIRVKMFYSILFLKLLLRAEKNYFTGNEKKMGVTDFVS